ncbi:hypothetical protein [Paeniglutamicibacter antarcticus]|uniref:hypothetical protein n=1 Tax=Paeniglutamicibacter antarcticus TaxID=494023 RepID=UPI001AE960D3
MIAIGLAIGMLTLAASIKTGFWSFLWSGVGSALLSTALALVISEIVLKPLLVRDLLGMTQLRDRIADISMRDLGPANRVRWEELYSSAKDIDLVVDSPTVWMERDLERVVACASRRSRVRVFLPSTDGPLRDEVNGTESGLREAWIRRQNKHERAVLEVWYLKLEPTSFMGRFDDEVVVAIDAGLPIETKSKIYLHLGTEGTSDVQTWIKDRWQWADSDVEGTLAWASPKPLPEPAEVRKSLGTKLKDTGGPS